MNQTTKNRHLGDPTQVGKYKLLGHLGEGGQAKVYLALLSGPSDFRKLVVLKILRESAEHDLATVRAFMKEARIAAQISHPYIVQTQEVGEADGYHYIAMEYVRGQTMRAIERKLEPDRLPLHLHVGILVDVARALHHVHMLTSLDGKPLHLVHRDISPQNVMVTYEGVTKLLDFGIAKTSTDEQTSAGVMKGKLGYMAPEQIRGDEIDRRADVFALGVMLWQAVTGRRFTLDRADELASLQARLEGREPRLRDAAPDAPAYIVEACDRALAVDPADRFDSAEDFADVLVQYLNETTGGSYTRELGTVVSRAFTVEREHTNTLVEEQIQTISRAKPVDVSTTFSTVLDEPSRSRESMKPRPPAPSAPPMRLIAGAVVATAAITALLLLWLDRAPSDPPPAIPAAAPSPAVAATPPPAAPDVPATSTPPPVESASLHVNATPGLATIELDGVILINHETHVMPSDSEEHVLVVRAPGYATVRRVVALEGPLTLDIALRRARSTGASDSSSGDSPATEAPPSTSSVRSPPSTREPEPPPSTPREEPRSGVLRPQVDTEDPYQ